MGIEPWEESSLWWTTFFANATDPTLSCVRPAHHHRISRSWMTACRQECSQESSLEYYVKILNMIDIIYKKFRRHLNKAFLYWEQHSSCLKLECWDFPNILRFSDQTGGLVDVFRFYSFINSEWKCGWPLIKLSILAFCTCLGVQRSRIGGRGANKKNIFNKR